MVKNRRRSRRSNLISLQRLVAQATISDNNRHHSFQRFLSSQHRPPQEQAVDRRFRALLAPQNLILKPVTILSKGNLRKQHKYRLRIFRPLQTHHNRHISRQCQFLASRKRLRLLFLTLGEVVAAQLSQARIIIPQASSLGRQIQPRY